MTATPFVSTFVSTRTLTVAVSAFALAACASVRSSGLTPTAVEASAPGAVVRDTARFEVTFVPSWNPATNPTEYPFAHAKQGFLTPAIGATHGSGYRIFAPGARPTPGLETLSETGKPSPLDAEIMSAIDAGDAEQIIRFEHGSDGPVHAAIATTFAASTDAPLVSIVGMIAPSPDWFYGVSAVDLREGGGWCSCLSIPVYAWDSGGDAGTTYLAEDSDLEPKQPTRKADTRHFMRAGEPAPVGFLVIKRIPAQS